MKGPTLFPMSDATPLSPLERRARGKAMRVQAPRSSHADWSPDPHRPDPISLLEESDKTRVASLVPIRYGRMSLSPFAFLRGSAVIMACDLAKTPVSGISAQICGDAHLLNFGTYATPERRQVFDVNDFDETLSGPWEWDIKRLATSVVVAGRHNGFSARTIRQATIQCIQAYQTHMNRLSTMGYAEVWYSTVNAKYLLQFVHRHSNLDLNKALEKAHQQTNVHIFPQLTQRVEGTYEIKDHPPLITHMHENKLREQIQALLEGYRASLQEDRRVLLNRYRLVDLAYKVVGVGSVGTRCYVALLLGSDQHDPLFIQIKEAQASVLEAYLSPSPYENHAQRVVYGQRMMQAASDLFLGWTGTETSDFYLRQLRDQKYSPPVEKMNALALTAYGKLCGFTLARAHARSADPGQISGYLGTNDVFDQAVASFAERYADQVEHDYAQLKAAIQAGRIAVVTGV
jgi:uncharacterized protein (DUF2252 family)